MNARSMSRILSAAVTGLVLSGASALAEDFFIPDGDVPALIAAIHIANSNGEPDTIHLAPAGTYVLVAPDNVTIGANGLPVVSSEITIAGNGAVIRRASGAPPFRILFVGGTGNLALDGLTIRGGEQPEDLLGGNIYNDGGTVRATGCTISFGVAGDAAGVLNHSLGMLTLTDSSVTSNQSLSGPGAGVLNESGFLTIENSIIGNNAGRGVVNRDDATVSGSVIRRNAGGISNSGVMTVTDSTIAYNDAGAFGGGVNNSAEIVITASVISDNSAGFMGGGLYNEGAATLTNCGIIGNAVYSPNVPGMCGGGIANDQMGTVTVTNCQIVNNSSFSDIDAYGGGICNMSGSFTLTGSTIRSNSVADPGGATGGGIINGSGGALMASDSAIRDNVADAPGGRGGGIAISFGGTVMLVGCTIDGNVAGVDGDGGEGGGVFSEGVFIAESGSISGNCAYRAGGMANHELAEAVLNACAVESNVAEDFGGGIVNSSVMTLTACVIRNNTAELASGGGIVNAGQATLTDITVTGNAAGITGAGILNIGGELTLTGGTIAANAAGSSGGGIGNFTGGILNVTNATVSGNAAGTGGGVTNSPSGIVTLTACTINHNTAQGVYTNGPLTLSNSIVASSTAADIVGAYTDAGHNIVEDGSGITHPTSFAADPLLGPLADNGGPTWTHALLPGSPAIDAGDCAGGAVSEDQRSVPRPQGAACDIGAFELEHGDCYADCNGDGEVNTLDFICFFNLFTAGDPAADCNGDGEVNTLDFICFLNAFNAGCP